MKQHFRKKRIWMRKSAESRTNMYYFCLYVYIFLFNSKESTNKQVNKKKQLKDSWGKKGKGNRKKRTHKQVIRFITSVFFVISIACTIAVTGLTILKMCLPFSCYMDIGHITVLLSRIPKSQYQCFK